MVFKPNQLEPFPRVINLDELDKQILTILQDDGKKSLRNIAEDIEAQTGVKHSISTIKSRIDALIEQKVIESFIAVVNCNRIGYREMMHFYIQIRPEVIIQDVVDRLLDIEEINVIYLMAGEFPVFCIAKCVDKPDQIKLLERIKTIYGIEKVNTQIVIQRIKEDMRVKIPDHC